MWADQKKKSFVKATDTDTVAESGGVERGRGGAVLSQALDLKRFARRGGVEALQRLQSLGDSQPFVCLSVTFWCCVCVSTVCVRFERVGLCASGPRQPQPVSEKGGDCERCLALSQHRRSSHIRRKTVLFRSRCASTRKGGCRIRGKEGGGRCSAL